MESSFIFKTMLYIALCAAVSFMFLLIKDKEVKLKHESVRVYFIGYFFIVAIVPIIFALAFGHDLRR